MNEKYIYAVTTKMQDKIGAIKNFLKNAFCVDGSVSQHFVKFDKMVTMLFEMEDSKRGKFGVILLTEEDLKKIEKQKGKKLLDS